MDVITLIIGGSLILIFIGTPIVLFFQIIQGVLQYIFGDWWDRNLFLVRYDPLIHQYLHKNFRYYQYLEIQQRRLFVKRVTKFLRYKEFEGRQGLFVSPEMEVLVAASAIQLTFGLPGIYFRHFDKIILYPEHYYSTITGRYHHGEVNTQGIIVLSWKNFHDGYLNPDDGRNLGLHEMAHALKFVDASQSDENDFFDRNALFRFIHYAREEMSIIQNGYDSFFRSYAATNDHEFFAVAIENFFERPREFYEYHPQMYHVMVHLLNQNPQLRQRPV